MISFEDANGYIDLGRNPGCFSETRERVETRTRDGKYFEFNPSRKNVNRPDPAPVQESAIAEGTADTGTLDHSSPSPGGTNGSVVATRERSSEQSPTSIHLGLVASKPLVHLQPHTAPTSHRLRLQFPLVDVTCNIG